jgi:hypothetical protein
LQFCLDKYLLGQSRQKPWFHSSNLRNGPSLCANRTFRFLHTPNCYGSGAHDHRWIELVVHGERLGRCRVFLWQWSL